MECAFSLWVSEILHRGFHLHSKLNLTQLKFQFKVMKNLHLTDITRSKHICTWLCVYASVKPIFCLGWKDFSILLSKCRAELRPVQLCSSTVCRWLDCGFKPAASPSRPAANSGLCRAGGSSAPPSAPLSPSQLGGPAPPPPAAASSQPSRALSADCAAPLPVTHSGLNIISILPEQ